MKTLSNIQVLRGLAATAVMVAHAVGMLIYGDVPVSLPNVEWGAFGVDVFFVVSGFVMAYASADLFGRTGAVLPFLGRRAVRVVPLYWLACVAFALVTLPGVDTATDVRHLAQGTLRSMMFVPAANGDTSVLPTGWTLFSEMGFYLCFACALPFRRRPALVGLGVGLAALGAAGTAGWTPLPISCMANLQNLEFVAGLAIAEARLCGWRVPGRIGMALACATLVYVVMKAPHMDGWTAWRGLAWGLPAALIVGGLALAREAARPSHARAALERLGDASYSIYLVHFPLFWGIGDVFGWFPRSGPHHAQIYAVLLVPVGLAVSLAVHRLFEVPVTRRLQRLLRRQARDAAAFAPSSAAEPSPAVATA